MYFDSTPMGLRQMRMDAKIKRIYAEASQDIQAKIDKYNKRFKALDAEWQQRVKDGKATKAEYDNWKAGQVFIGKRWESVRDDILHQIHTSNDTASRIISGEKRAIFIDNVNHAEYSIDKDFDFGLSFNLYDSATLTRILRDDPQILPEVSTDPNRDYAWGRKQITSAITQGIIQGESIPEIGKRIGEKLGSSNQKHMQRLARTAMTSAQNAGRIEAMQNAMEMGIKVQKEWIATLDNRTRDSHQHLDGQVQDVDKPFLSVLGDIMYPGDPDADPANVWNCFIGETKIASDSEIIRSYKHDYSGLLFTFKCSCGVEFTCTPNHPILTRSGWTSAQLINKGDDLLIAHFLEDDMLRVNPDIDHVFPSIDTIHEFDKMMGGKRTCSLSVNFHGDIPTSEVEIITKKRLLRKDRNISGFKTFDKFLFKLSDSFVFCKRHFMSCFGRIYISLLSLMGRMSKTLPFFRRGISHSNIHGFRSVSSVNTTVFESEFNSTSCDTEILSDCFDGFSGIIFADNVVDIKVSSVRHIPVYNLQTENSRYFVNSNPIIQENVQKCNGSYFAIAHNCRCSLGYEYPDYKNQYDQRRARNEEGQNELIDNMTYDQWKDWVNKGKPVKQKEQPEVKEQTVEVKAKETTEPETWIDRIKNNVKNHTDDWTIEELQENGRIFVNQVNEAFNKLNSSLTIDHEQVDQVRIELDQYNEKMDSIQKKIDKLSENIKQYEDLLYENLTNKELSKKYEKLLKESSLELDKAKKEQQSIKIAITDLSRKEHELTHPQSTVKIEEVVVKTLSELREVGGINKDNISNYMNEDLNLRNKDKVRENLINAMNCYPTSWLKTSGKSRRELCPNYIRDDQRAYYDFSTGEIRISNDKSANVHELGHRFEDVISGIVESESKFYKKRTDGEPLVWLGAPYKRSEKSRKDHFVHPYMGKDYGNQESFELVSMGFQYAFTEYNTLAKDEDMQSWIFGLLTSIE